VEPGLAVPARDHVLFHPELGNVEQVTRAAATKVFNLQGTISVRGSQINYWQPLGTLYVAACLKVLEESGLTYELHGMGTIVEGDPRELFDVFLRMHEVPFDAGALRVVTTVKVDDRRDKEASAKEKVGAVKRHLGGE